MFFSEKTFVHPPMLVGNENPREHFFGQKDKNRTVPKKSHPFSRRFQYNQGLKNNCTVGIYAELVENKVFWQTGEWFEMAHDEIIRVWELMIRMGIAGEQWGAYINSPLIATNENVFKMKQRNGGKTITVRTEDWFPVVSKNVHIEQYVKEIKKEIAFGGGVLSGINSRQTTLDYYGAKNAPYILEHRDDRRPIAHAVVPAEFNDDIEDTYFPEPLTIAMPGTWGEKFGKDGVVFIRQDDIKELFAPIGFTIKIT